MTFLCSVLTDYNERGLNRVAGTVGSQLNFRRFLSYQWTFRESQCFPRRSWGEHGDSRGTKFTVPLGTSH